MTDITTYPVPASAKKFTHMTDEQYLVEYNESINDPDTFWARKAKEFLSWQQPWDQVCQF
jgi:acetyl-CoA synthetase